MAVKALTRWRDGGVACVLVGTLLLVLLTTENTLPADDEIKSADLPADLAKIPSDALLFVSGRVADLWNSDASKSVKEKLAKDFQEGTREFETKFGLPLDQVERFSLAILNFPQDPEPLLFVGTTKAYDRDKVIAAGDAGKKETYKQQTFYIKGTDWAVYPLGERALVYGRPAEIRALIGHPRKSEGNLAAGLRLAAGKHSAVYAWNVKVFNDVVGDKLPGEAEPFKPLLQARYATLTMDVAKDARTEVMLTFATEKDVQAALKPARTGLDLARVGLERGIEELNKQKEMSQFVALLKQLQGGLKKVQVEPVGKTLRASVQCEVDVANVGLVLVEGVRKMRASASRAQSSNNLKQIAIAMHNHNDATMRLPAHATYNKDGKPMLSWRVMILPYIEQQALYNEFHLNEPWDSEHNKKLIARMPRTYASPQDEKTLREHTTHYQGFFGKGAFFDGKQGLRFPADFPDGTSNTFMIVEASKAVPWTKPEDLPYDPKKPLPKLGLPGAVGFLAGFCDGSVHFVAQKTEEKTLRLLIERNDGMPIPGDF